MQTQTRSDFMFKFTGVDASCIDVSTLTTTLNNLNELMLKTADANYPKSKCELKITATRAGSFEIDLSMVTSVLVSLLSPPNVEYAKCIVETIVGFFMIKEHLKNKKPKNVEYKKDGVVVENSNNKKQTFNKSTAVFFKNPKFENCIVNIVGAANKDENIDGIHIKQCDGADYFLPKEQLTQMDQSVIEDPESIKQEFERIDTFYIKSPDLRGNSQWQFQNDKVFYAKISDEIWLDDYKKGKHVLVPNIQMRARIKVTCTVDEHGIPLENSSKYEIVEVMDTIYPNDNQMRL